MPRLAWRLDRVWQTLRNETPAVTRPPSEIIREHFWLTTQPRKEPEHAAHLADTIGWIGWDRLLFATDYPHWDYDDPQQALRLSAIHDQRQGFFLDNARRLYLGAA